MTNVGGNKYIVDEKTDFLVNYPVEINEVECLLRKICVDRCSLERKGILAKRKVAIQFDVENTLNRLVDVYEAVLGD